MNVQPVSIYRKAMQMAHGGLPVGDSEQFSANPIVKTADALTDTTNLINNNIGANRPKNTQEWADRYTQQLKANPAGMAMAGYLDVKGRPFDFNDVTRKETEILKKVNPPKEDLLDFLTNRGGGQALRATVTKGMEQGVPDDTLVNIIKGAIEGKK